MINKKSNAIDLSKELKKYKSGWVAIDQKTHKVVFHTKDFASLMKMVPKSDSLVAMPAVKEYSRSILLHG